MKFLINVLLTFKDKRVNLRMSSKDLEAIKTYVVEEGLPYQTLMSKCTS